MQVHYRTEGRCTGLKRMKIEVESLGPLLRVGDDKSPYGLRVFGITRCVPVCTFTYKRRANPFGLTHQCFSAEGET